MLGIPFFLMANNTLVIGDLSLKNPYILAPLAGYTDLAFRLLCRQAGAALCYSEMVSCHGLSYAQKNTLQLLKTTAEERPFGVQLFGSDPLVMGRAAAIASTYPIDLIDINMGCPVKKVVKKGAGAALMKDPLLAEQIIKAVCDNTKLPVTVKCRSGWTSDMINAPEFARMAEGAGAAAIIIHARTWAQAFGGTADWQIIEKVKKTISIPVIGNGDISRYEDGIKMMESTGCDGVMIGRGALGNPWVFQQQGRPTTLSGRWPMLKLHMELAAKYLAANKMLFRIKNHASRYLTGLPGASKIRQEITSCKDIETLVALFQQQ